MRIVQLKCESISCPTTRPCEKSQLNVKTKVTGMASQQLIRLCPTLQWPKFAWKEVEQKKG